MADGQIDPARLAGESLQRWYRRPASEIDQGRQAAQAQLYTDFFAGERDRALARRPLAWQSPKLTGNQRPLGQGHVCVACHGNAPTAPPSLHKPVFRSGSQPPSKPPERDRKQCEIQDQRDRDICGRQPNNAAKGVCHGTASKRYAHCLRTGEVGEPDLFTVPRMPRR